MKDNIGIISEVGMEGVVLKMRRIEVVSSELIASELSNDSLEIVHCEKVRIVPAGCLESN
jgi:hypothetical protein